jgi:hypothetical protein
LIRALVIMPRSPTSTMRGQGKALAQLGNHGTQRTGIGAIALKDFNRHRAALGVGQQSTTPAC